MLVRVLGRSPVVLTEPRPRDLRSGVVSAFKAGRLKATSLGRLPAPPARPRHVLTHGVRLGRTAAGAGLRAGNPTEPNHEAAHAHLSVPLRAEMSASRVPMVPVQAIRVRLGPMAPVQAIRVRLGRTAPVQAIRVRLGRMVRVQAIRVRLGPMAPVQVIRVRLGRMVPVQAIRVRRVRMALVQAILVRRGRVSLSGRFVQNARFVSSTVGSMPPRR
jgi:hypothetical protein